MNEKDQLNLREYIKSELSKGLSISQIETTAITQGGWTKQDVADMYKSISPSISAGDRKPSTPAVGNKSKFWYLLSIPVLASYWWSTFRTISFVADQYLAETITAVGLILLFTFLLIKSIVTSASEHRIGKVVFKIILLFLLNLAFWALNAMFNSCFDCDPPIVQNYQDSFLPPISTNTNETFSLEPGQTAIISDINATFKYTGYKSGAWVNEPLYEFTYNYPPYSEIIRDYNNPESYLVNMRGSTGVFSNGGSVMNFIVEKPGSVCENREGEEADACWYNFAERKNNVEYCLLIKDTTRHPGCISQVAESVYNTVNYTITPTGTVGDPSLSHDRAREICKLDTSSEFNFCKIIGTDQFIGLKACVEIYNNSGHIGFSQQLAQCMNIAKSMKIGNAEDCQSLPESDTKEVCRNMFDPSSLHYYENE